MAAVNTVATQATGGGALSEPLVLQALRLIAGVNVADARAAARLRERLAAWRCRSVAHEAAHAEAWRRWQVLDGAAAMLKTQWPDPMALPGDRADPNESRSRSRRRIIAAGLGGLGLATLGGLSSWQQWQATQPLHAQHWRTGTGQLLHAKLPDAPAGAADTASSVDLSARSAVTATLYRDRREALLLEGEARFVVRPDAARPFVVRTRAGRIEVVGTVFTVADRGSAVGVAVERGRVRVHPAAAGATPVDLVGGEALDWLADDLPGAPRRVAVTDVGAWREGWLVFDDRPLAEALPAINAFRRRPLVAADAAVGRLRLTARFRAVDEAGLAAALPVVLPVRLRPQADGSLRVERR